MTFPRNPSSPLCDAEIADSIIEQNLVDAINEVESLISSCIEGSSQRVKKSESPFVGSPIKEDVG